MNRQALRDEVAGFFDGFVEAFRSFSGARIAALYLVPYVAARGDGSVGYLQSRADVERYFQAAVDGYYGDGCRPCRFKDLEVVPIGPRAALGTVTWELLRDDGTVLKIWRQSYNLVRIEGGLRVLASTDHGE